METVYRTSDGTLFDDEELAREYEEKLVESRTLVDDIRQFFATVRSEDDSVYLEDVVTVLTQHPENVLTLGEILAHHFSHFHLADHAPVEEQAAPWDQAEQSESEQPPDSETHLGWTPPTQQDSFERQQEAAAGPPPPPPSW